MSYDEQLQQLIKNALNEDIGDGDHSTLCCIEPQAKGKAILKVKQDGVLAGIEVAKKIFQFADDSIIFSPKMKDGEEMKYGNIAFEVEAAVHTILKCERLVLNTMQRMCGIATLTRKYTNKLQGYRTQLLDTRKTTPNFRLLEKQAVKTGGAVNHRFGLFDMIMLKDNHIDYSGGLEKAIDNAQKYVKQKNLNLKIEVETRNIDEVKRVVKHGGVDRIMLDNFTPELVAEALKIINGKFETEASGGINLENLELYAATGVDFISSGAIIHQAVNLDLSLKAVSIK